MATQFKIVRVSPRGRAAGNPWIDTGLNINATQRLTIVATGRIHLYTVEGSWAMPWVGPEGCASFGSNGECPLFANWNSQTLNGQPAGSLIAKIGGAGAFGIGRFQDQLVSSTGRLYLAVNDLDAAAFYADNRGSFTALIAIDAPGVPLHDGECPFCHDTSPSTVNPIKLQTGDKTWSGTDLEVQTPAGKLAFTRSYTQSKQNHTDYQFMGLGWSHNHAYKLTLSGSSPTRNAEVYLPEGGSLKLSETAANHFDAGTGSTSVLDYDTTNSEYVLTAQDKSQLVFHGTTLQLKRRTWSNGESWAYSYYVLADGADLDGKLKQIDDGYSRLLRFAYIRDTDPNAYQRRKLWRVGDQTSAATLTNTTPSGRYIELAYTPEKLNGTVVSGAMALLSSVRDLRGNSWVYDYYGQTSGVGQTDPLRLNFLSKRLSPSVDTGGDGVADGSIVLEEAIYTPESTTLAINGDMEAAGNWNAVGTPVTNAQSTTVKDSGTYSRYLETSAAGQGIESDNWDLAPGRVYIITARVYPVAGRVKMQVKGTSFADESQDGTSTWETLRLVYNPAGDAQQRRIQFITSAMPGSGNAKVYIDTVTVSRLKGMTQKRGDAQLVTDMAFAAGDINVTTEIVAQKKTTHYFANGTYVGPANPTGEVSSQTIALNYRPSNRTDAKGNSTQIDWSASGKALNGVTDPLGQDTSFIYDSSDRLVASVDAQGRKTVYGYDAAQRQPAFVLVDEANNLAVNGSMEADSNWTSLNSPSRNQRTPTAQTGSFLRHVVASAAGQGMESVGMDLEAGHSYKLTARIFVVSGAVKMQVTGTSAFDQVVTDTGVWRSLQVVHSPSTHLGTQKVQFVASGGAAEFYVDSVSMVKSGLELAVNGGMEQDSSWANVGSPTTNARSSVRVDSGMYARRVVTSTAGQGIIGNNWPQVANQVYTITARVYPVSGVVKMQVPGLTDANTEKVTTEVGRWQTLKFIQLSASAAPSRAVQFVSAGAAEFYVDSVSVVKADAELVSNGDMETDEKWTSVNSPTTHEQIIGANSGGFARRVAASAAGQGIEGAAWGMVANRTYAITARVYPVSGAVKMQVSTQTAFDKTSDAIGAWQTLRATYTPTADATGLKLQFVASGGAAEWYVDTVAITEIGAELAVNGGMEVDSNWTNVSTPTTNARSTTQVESGSYARRIVASAAGQGMEGVAWNMVANRTYLIMARVYPVSGAVKMKVSGTTAFDKISSGTGAWQTLRAIHTPTSAATGVKLQFFANAGAAEFYVNSVHIIDVFKLLQWQEFRYDNKGRTLLEARLNPKDGSVQQQVTRTYGTSGNSHGLLDSVTETDPLNPGTTTSTLFTYDNLGRVIKTQKTSLFGSCQFSYTVYDEAGQVVATVCSLENVTAPTTVAAAKAMYVASDPDKNKVATYEYDALGRQVKVTTDAGSGTTYTLPGTGLERSNLTFYDGLDRVVRTITNYVNQSGGSAKSPGAWVWSISNSRWEKSSGNTTPIAFGSDNNENVISQTTYNDRGMVRSQRDGLGNVTLYGYDDAGRLIKTIQNAAQDPYNNDYNTIINGSPDPTLGNYVPVSTADKDIITSQSYDAAGNLIRTVDALGMVSYTVYDALNRPVKTVQAAKDKATLEVSPGEVAYNAAHDPRSDDYEASADPDRDLIQTTEYDNLGRVIRTKRLLENRGTLQWETTLYGYDTLGRQIKVIQKASQPAYTVNSDPGLASYNASSAVDQDIVTKTAYDPNGRVMYTEDTLGARTWMAYDGLGRQVKTVVNAVGTDENGTNADPRSSSYIVSTDSDKDLITLTTYDADGRVQSTQDALGRVTRNVYDTRGRVIRTIGNYVASGATNPKDWLWSTTNNRWENGSGSAISFGTDKDKNVINDTVYDAQGRVSQTIDPRHNTTHVVYDKVGRRLKTITNYVASGATDPKDWLWSTTNNRWENGSGSAISFGTDKDQNRISLAVYDVLGRVTRSRDAAGIETRFSYDALGRQTQTIANYVDGTFSSAAPDEDLISTTAYNKAGQVVLTTDARSTQTAFTYDKAGRLRTITQAAANPLASMSYTCYDKAGRVVRTIENWSNDPTKPSPDAKDAGGTWSFVPTHNGSLNDRDLVTSYLLDRAGRSVQVVNPTGDESLMAYDKDGQMAWMRDPEYSVTQYRYDKLRRRTRVVQGYQPVPINEKIAFISFQPGTYDVFTMDTSGTGQTNISSAAGQDGQPDYSPDGSKIVFVSDRNGVNPTFFYDVYVMNANGSNLQRLTNLSGYATEAAWSPDGGQIAFSFKAATYYAIYVMNADGSNLRAVYDNPGLSAGQPKWSPDGQRLAFYGSVDNFATVDIYTIHTNGTQLLNLTNNAQYSNAHPAWSWDGSKIAFSSLREGNREIYVMNADGSNPINVSQYAGADDRRPNWSPDGSKIVFSSTRDTPNYEVYVMNADGSGQTRLTTNTLYNQNPNWTKTVVNPANWLWSSGSSRWEDGAGNALPHGTDNDRNIIVDVTYDKGGRVVTQREPRGYLTTYGNDDLDRRKTLTNPLSKQWLTTYTDLSSGKSQVSMQYPGISGSANYAVNRTFDRLGRLQSVQYNETGTLVTPDVVMTYDDDGNRSKMSEYGSTGFTNRKRETLMTYDKVHRLKQAAFDNDGNGTVDETVSYEYDAGGLRTKLTLPGSLNVVYTYDQRGQLVSLTDWDSQQTQFAYDGAGRHVVTERANGLRSSYRHDPAGRLERLRHSLSTKTIADFKYTLDKRGNRVQAREAVAKPTTTNDTIIAYNDAGIVLGGAWLEVGSFRESVERSASLKLMFMGDEATLSMGEGPDHSMYDVYLNGSLWQSFDGYAATAAQRNIVVTTGVDSRKLQSEGPHLLEIRNRSEKHKASTGYKLRFSQLLVTDREWTLETITYKYDRLSRLLEARHAKGINTAALDAELNYHFRYTYDRAGNRTQWYYRYTNPASSNTVAYSYNAANQPLNDQSYSYGYDDNGNRNVIQPSSSYAVWDRANRMVSGPPGSMVYDGAGNRVKQTAGTDVSAYLLDTQPGLPLTLVETLNGSSVSRYVHGPRGIHAQKDAAANWEWLLADGLGSVRVVVDNSGSVLESRQYDPYGGAFGTTGTSQTNYGFTGEQRAGNTELMYLRARYYATNSGAFVSLDPVETPNRYAYVVGNPINGTDPSGLQGPCIDPVTCNNDEPRTPPNWSTYVQVQFSMDTNEPKGVYVGSSWSVVQIGSGTKDVIQVTANPTIPLTYLNNADLPGTTNTIAAVYIPNGYQIYAAYNSQDITLGNVLQALSAELNIGRSYNIGSQDAVQATQTAPTTATQPFVDPILEAIAQGQCLETPDPNFKKCDPAKALVWMLGRGIVKSRGGDSYDYQRRYSGFKYKVPTGTGEEIEADGARAMDCALIEAKYVGSPAASPFIIGSSARRLPFVSDLNNSKSIDYQQNDEFRRYGLALHAPESINPFVKLEVITNNFAAVPYFQFWINRNNVPSVSFRYGP